MSEFELLMKVLDEQEAAYKESLLTGKAKDYAEYRHLVGVLTGLALARREITEIQRRYEENYGDN